MQFIYLFANVPSHEKKEGGKRNYKEDGSKPRWYVRQCSMVLQANVLQIRNYEPNSIHTSQIYA